MRQGDPSISRRRALTQAAALAVSAALPAIGRAQEWKAAKPIRLIVPWTPGGASDILARLVATTVGEKLGQPIVVDNKPGANGSIGSQAAATAAPDGTTLVVAVTDSHSIYPHVFPKPVFVAKEQTPVAPLAVIPFCLLARADFPANSVKEFIALAKTRSISYASWGNASAPHTATLMLARSTGLKDMLHVPYQGTAPAIQAVLAGQVDVVMGPVLMAVTNRPKLKALAVMTPQRVESLPDVPTFAEQGVAVRKDGEFWIGIFAPPKTPAHIVNALSQTFTQAVAQPAFTAKVAQLGMIPQIEPPAQYAKFFQDDYEGWGKLVRETGIRIE